MQPLESLPTTLYRFYDANGALLYAGISGELVRRFGRHRLNQPWWGNVASATFEHFQSRRIAEMAEAAAIKNEKPRHNVYGNRPEDACAFCRGPIKHQGPGAIYCNSACRQAGEADKRRQRETAERLRERLPDLRG